MAEIHVLPGIERPDLCNMPEPNAVLQAAIDAGVTQLVLIGRDRTGQLYLASSVDDAEKCLGMLMRCANIIMNNSIVHETYETAK